MRVKLSNVQKNRITSAIWKFGDAVKRADYDPNHDDSKGGVVLPREAVAEVEEAILAAVENG